MVAFHRHQLEDDLFGGGGTITESNLSPSYYSFDPTYKVWDPLVWTQVRGNVQISNGHHIL